MYALLVADRQNGIRIYRVSVKYWYRVSIKSFPDYEHLLQENYVEYKHIFLPSVLMCCKKSYKKLLELSYILKKKNVFVFHVVFL